MNVAWVLLRREMQLVARRPADVFLPLGFYAVAATLFPLGMGPEPELLKQVAPGVLWIGALLATLLALPQLYGSDWQDGALDQLMLPPHAVWRLVLVKALAHWLSQALPLLLVAPLLALMFGVGPDALPLLALTLLMGTPCLSLIGGLAAALTLGVRNGALLNLVIVLPLVVPMLIFGTGALSAQAAGQPVDGHLSLLAAVSLMALLIAPPATAAALRIAVQ